MAQKYLYIIHSVHRLIICRFRVWKAAILSSAASNMLQRAGGAATTQVPLHLWTLVPSHTFQSSHGISKSNSNLMWKNCLCVSLYFLLSYSEGRPAGPCMLLENRISPMPGSTQNMWLEGCDDRQPSSPGTSVLSVPGILTSRIHSTGLQDASALQNCL